MAYGILPPDLLFKLASKVVYVFSWMPQFHFVKRVSL